MFTVQNLGLSFGKHINIYENRFLFSPEIGVAYGTVIDKKIDYMPA